MPETAPTKPIEYPPTPMLDKMLAVKDDSQQIGNFLEWLQSNNIYLCHWIDAHYEACSICQGTGYDPTDEFIQANPEYTGSQHGCPACGGLFNDNKGTGRMHEDSQLGVDRRSINDILHDYFEVDANAEEQERRAVLEWVRSKSK